MPQNTPIIAELRWFVAERVVGEAFGLGPADNFNDFRLTAAVETIPGSGIWHLEKVNAGPCTISVAPIAFCVQTFPR